MNRDPEKFLEPLGIFKPSEEKINQLVLSDNTSILLCGPILISSHSPSILPILFLL